MGRVRGAEWDDNGLCVFTKCRLEKGVVCTLGERYFGERQTDGPTERLSGGGGGKWKKGEEGEEGEEEQWSYKERYRLHVINRQPVASASVMMMMMMINDGTVTVIRCLASFFRQREIANIIMYLL